VSATLLKIVTPNDDGTVTCITYELNTNTHERKQLGEGKKYRLATEDDREAHARGELKDRTLVAYEPENFSPILYVEVE
jgi:hypothetical protein